MQKSDIVKSVAINHDLSNRKAKQIVNEIFDQIKEGVTEGERVIITGFGTFEKRDRGARVTTNPRTHEKMNIPATKTVHFRTGAPFKRLVKE